MDILLKGEDLLTFKETGCCRRHQRRIAYSWTIPLEANNGRNRRRGEEETEEELFESMGESNSIYIFI